MVSETEYLVDLLESNWNAAITALQTTGGTGAIADVHAVHPIILDIRNFKGGKSLDAHSRAVGGNRINMASKKESVLSDDFTDATCDTIITDKTVTHDANANIVQGLSVAGTGIPSGTTIALITNSTTFELSNAATATNTNVTLTFGEFTYSRDIIVIMETGNSIDYPTIMWDIRDETYNMSISVRTRQDDRILNDDTRISPQGTFGVERIQSLYLLVRYIIEQKRRGWLKTGSQIYENVNQIMLGDRTESNDKKNRIFGYKINVVMKKLARPV